MPQYDNSNAADWGFDTRSIHAGQTVDSDTSARNLPIFLTSSYVFDNAEHAETTLRPRKPRPGIQPPHQPHR